MMEQVKEEKHDTTRWWWGHPGFYDREVENSVEITVEYRDQLLKGQENGWQIDEDENGYPILIEPGPKTSDEWCEATLARITEFDTSNQVNRCFIGDLPAWFDKAMRNGLRSTLDAEESVGKQTTTLWIGSEPSVAVGMRITDARQMLSALEIYSKEVFDVTQQHRAAVYAMTSVDEIKAYDHTVGYPEKLQFET